MSTCAWGYSIERETLPWCNPTRKGCQVRGCVEVWGYIARDRCDGSCGRKRAHVLRHLLCEGHAIEWCRRHRIEFPRPPADRLPSGAVAVVEYQAANREEWEPLLTIGPDYSQGPSDYFDVPRHIVGVRVRTVWDKEREGTDQPLRAACLCKAKDTEPEEGAKC